MEKNSNDLNEKNIGIITSDFVKVSENLKLACSKIISNNFSNYPMIIMSKESVSIGTLFIDIGELMNNSWKYYATYLEVLIEKKIIQNRLIKISIYSLKRSKFESLIVLHRYEINLNNVIEIK